MDLASESTGTCWSDQRRPKKSCVGNGNKIVRHPVQRGKEMPWNDDRAGNTWVLLYE